MEDCRALFAVLISGASPQEKVDASARLKAVFQKLSADAKAALVAGDACLPALLHVIDGGLHAAWVGACGALNSLLTDLPKENKQALISGEKGVVDALLHVLADSEGNAAWNYASICLWELFINTSAECREALLSDGRGVVEALVGVLDGDEAGAWARAAGALSSFFSGISSTALQSLLSYKKSVIAPVLRLIGNSSHGAFGSASKFTSALLAGIPRSAKSAFLLTQPQLVSALTVCLESEDSHRCWGDAMGLLKRLVYQEPSLSHINLCTLDFLKRDGGFHAALERCSRGLGSEIDVRNYESICGVLLTLGSCSNPPILSVSSEFLAPFVMAAQLCSDDKALRSFSFALSNLSESFSVCSALALAKCHEYALSKVVGVSASDPLWNDTFSVCSMSLTLIVNMSRDEALHADLKQCQVIEILAPLADEKCAAQLRTLMAMSYLIGCKESSANSGGALAQVANSSSIGKIVDCLENTLNLKGGPGYGFGSVVLPAILQV